MESVLSAFCLGDEVMYIGKTTQSLRQRFAGCRRPGSGQQPNIRVLVFAEPHQLDRGSVPIDLPAGLEDGLIERCLPPWDVLGAEGGAARRARTESRRLEDAACRRKTRSPANFRSRSARHISREDSSIPESRRVSIPAMPTTPVSSIWEAGKSGSHPLSIAGRTAMARSA